MRDSWQSPSQRPPFRWPSCNSGIALSTKKPTITPSSASTGGSWEWLGIKAMDINCGELLSKTVLDSKAAGYGHSVSPCKRKDTSKKLQDVIMSFTLYLLSIVKSFSHITQKSACTLHSSILISFLRNSLKSLLVFPPVAVHPLCSIYV